MDIKISVIIPVYNQERYLIETIESVLAQTYSYFELILIDDGSIDNSANIIKQYAAQDNRIVAILQANTGKPKAVNSAASIAKGEYLAFMDHDDLMLPDRLEKQLTFLETNSELDACSCHCYYVDDKGKALGTQRYPYLKTAEQCRNVLANKEIVVCAFTGLTAKKSAFLDSGGLQAKFWPNDDMEFFNRFIEKGFALVVMQTFLMNYRVHASSTTIINTWNIYVDMNDYTTHCITARRNNQSEISYEEFREIENAKHWLSKANRKRHFYAVLFQKEAGFAMYSKKYLSFLWKILIASLLHPSFMVATVRKRLELQPT